MKAPLLALAALALSLAGCGGGAGGGGDVQYPRLSGRVVDTANLLPPAREAELTRKLEALERGSSRQLVVATVPDLQGREIADYGVGLARAWRIGRESANNGTILLVAVAERKIRVEVGYGLEGIVTDAVSSQIIRERITPRFQANDYAGGIEAGTDAIIEQLRAPPEAAEQRVAEATRAQSAGGGERRRGSGSGAGLFIWGGVLLFVLLSVLGRGLRGRRYGQRVSTWGPGDGRGGSGLGWMIFGMILGSIGRGSRGGGWGGGGGGGGGGFTGGGGSFGGGGASGGW